MEPWERTWHFNPFKETDLIQALQLLKVFEGTVIVSTGKPDKDLCVLAFKEASVAVRIQLNPATAGRIELPGQTAPEHQSQSASARRDNPSPRQSCTSSPGTRPNAPAYTFATAPEQMGKRRGAEHAAERAAGAMTQMCLVVLTGDIASPAVRGKAGWILQTHTCVSIYIGRKVRGEGAQLSGPSFMALCQEVDERVDAATRQYCPCSEEPSAPFSPLPRPGRLARAAGHSPQPPRAHIRTQRTLSGETPAFV